MRALLVSGAVNAVASAIVSIGSDAPSDRRTQRRDTRGDLDRAAVTFRCRMKLKLTLSRAPPNSAVDFPTRAFGLVLEEPAHHRVDCANVCARLVAVCVARLPRLVPAAIRLRRAARARTVI